MPEWFSEFFSHFHWLRPWWLLAIPGALLAVALLWHHQSRQSNWQQLIPEALLKHLLQGETHKLSRLPLIGLAVAWISASLALAGPSWEKIPQPIHKSEQALIVLLDLSPSMLAQDLKPSRLMRARLKLIDYLKMRDEGLTALIAFAGEAHVITPLTDDSKTITSLVPSLSPNIMPLAGSNPEMAVELALQLFQDAGINSGEILMLTDGIAPEAGDTINRLLNGKHRLSILGVGTDAGAPIPISNGGFAKDNNGGIVLAKLGSGELQQLSLSQGGHYRTLTATNSDIEALAQTPTLLEDNTREVQREFDLWLDRGPWVALIILPFLLLGFRRGWLLSVVLIAVPNPEPAMALEWQDLWQTQDQQAQQLLEQGDATAAAQKFKNQQWAGSAHYQANEFEAAAEAFSQADNAEAHYNRGNALARAGKLEEAIEAYDQALQQQPGFEDAQHNRQVVEQAQKQQEQQQNQQGQGENQENQDGQNQQNQDQQNQSGESSQQQNQQQGQNSEQQNSQNPNNQNQGQQNQSEPNSDQQEPYQRDPQEADSQDPSQDPLQDKPQQQAEQQTDEQNSEEQQAQAQQQDGEGEKQEQQTQQAQATEMSPEEKEQQQALEQFLRKVPDDPSGLMRNKFQYQYRERRKQYQQGTWQPPENNAASRW